ncbi:hypothetical protein NLP58_24420, partial [Escherichia coli]|nr:hypothetical protein [Escherichia coli]
VPLGAIQVETQQRRKVTILDRTIWTIYLSSPWVKVVSKNLFRLRNLLGNGCLQLDVGGHITNLAVALDLNQSASHLAAGWVEIKKRKIGSPEVDLIPQLFGVLPERLVQFQMRVQRHHDLVLENALMLKEQA